MTTQALNGILCVDKPQGFTSFDVVAKLRGILKTRKIGHSGTLDPMATGVLPVFVGNAAKAIDLMEDHDKAYVAEITLGFTTDTLDVTGVVTGRGSAAGISEEQFAAALSSFVGKISQLPPMYSAVKVEGRKLYELAREGREIERKPRAVSIYEARVLTRVSGDTYRVYVSCGRGTYIRSLADDLGKKLSCGAVLSALRRVKACGFLEQDCLTLPEIERRAGEGTLPLLPVESIFARLPGVALTAPQKKRFLNGAPLDAGRLGNLAPSGGKMRVYGEDGKFLGIGAEEEGNFKSFKLFLQ